MYSISSPNKTDYFEEDIGFPRNYYARYPYEDESSNKGQRKHTKRTPSVTAHHQGHRNRSQKRQHSNGPRRTRTPRQEDTQSYYSPQPKQPYYSPPPKTQWNPNSNTVENRQGPNGPTGHPRRRRKHYPIYRTGYRKWIQIMETANPSGTKIAIIFNAIYSFLMIAFVIIIYQVYPDNGKPPWMWDGGEALDLLGPAVEENAARDVAGHLANGGGGIEILWPGITEQCGNRVLAVVNVLRPMHDSSNFKRPITLSSSQKDATRRYANKMAVKDRFYHESDLHRNFWYETNYGNVAKKTRAEVLLECTQMPLLHFMELTSINKDEKDKNKVDHYITLALPGLKAISAAISINKDSTFGGIHWSPNMLKEKSIPEIIPIRSCNTYEVETALMSLAPLGDYEALKNSVEQVTRIINDNCD